MTKIVNQQLEKLKHDLQERICGLLLAREAVDKAIDAHRGLIQKIERMKQ